MLTQQTIAKFFRGECNSEELAAVHTYFEANPDAVHEYLSETEWEHFATNHTLPETTTQEIWQTVSRQTIAKPRIVSFFKPMLVAASILLFLVLGWLWSTRQQGSNKSIMASAGSQQKVIYNSSTHVQTILLSDSSIVRIYPKSRIVFPESFTANMRLVHVTGTAYFKVHKDNARPFNVIADSLVTTVLGTQFTVQADSLAGNMTVTLHEGKVSVHLENALFKGGIPRFVLSPNDIFTYNRLSREGSVNRAYNNTSNKQLKSVQQATTTNGILEGNNWYMFNNQSLYQVFDHLQSLYNARIEYNKADLKGMTFIGKIDKADTLYNILKSIATLNDLQLTRQGNNYIISKKQ